MNLRTVVACLAALVAVAACSADSESGSAPEPTVSIPADGAEFTPEEQEVVDAATRYIDAFYGRGTEPIAETIQGTATQQIIDDLVPAQQAVTEDQDLKWLGDYEFTVQTVSIDGDEASTTACLDASDSFLVARDATQITSASGSGANSVEEYQFERVDGQWLVSEPFSSGESC